MMADYPTCAQRVRGELNGRLEDLRTLLDLYPNGYDEELGSLDEYGLGFDYVEANTFKDQPAGYFRYQLSYGGPADEFRFYVDPQYHVDRIEYWFLDWWDGAHITLDGDQAAFMRDLWEACFEDYAPLSISESGG